MVAGKGQLFIDMYWEVVGGFSIGATLYHVVHTTFLL